ncbi:MAG: hypothetical protein HY816_16955, partial [Candidatus Wallbacteria bacterium]|nr:hypothetical protein [Candidatus Wallbacteria bacterium]
NPSNSTISYGFALTLRQDPPGDESEPAVVTVSQLGLPVEYARLYLNGQPVTPQTTELFANGSASWAELLLPRTALQGDELTAEKTDAAGNRLSPPVVLRTYNLFFHEQGATKLELGESGPLVLDARLVGGVATTARLLFLPASAPKTELTSPASNFQAGGGGGCALASSVAGGATQALPLALPLLWLWCRRRRARRDGARRSGSLGSSE